MKKTIKVLSLIFAVVLLTTSLFGCGNTTKPLWEVDTGKFNDGKVVYTKEAKTAVDMVDASVYGHIINKRVDGCELPLSESDVDLDSGMMMKTNVSNDNCYQWQLSLDGKVNASDEGTRNGLIVGTFLSNEDAKLGESSNGIFISFNQSAAKITLFAGSIEKSFEVKKGVIRNADLSIIGTYKNELFVYTGETLVFKASFSKDGVVTESSTGTETLASSFDMAILSGTRFNIASNCSTLKFDTVKVFNIPLPTEVSGEKITATPVGDNTLGLTLDGKSDLISICYSMWFNNVLGNAGEINTKKIYNITEILKEYKFSAKKGFYNEEGKTYNHQNAFHYWAEPAQGYYRSTDKDAIRNNMTMLYNAGVDFIICDYTYTSTLHYGHGTNNWTTFIDGPVTALLDTIMEMRAEGKGTPYVVFWTLNDEMFGDFKTYFLDIEKWKDCFVYYENNPLILRWNYQNAEGTGLTVRGMNGLVTGNYTYQWSYLHPSNRSAAAYDLDMNIEQMCCCVATQGDYMSNESSAQGRDGGCFWYSQWEACFDVRPKIVTITWWNEWMAQELKNDNNVYVFTDAFTQEYSRDIEPMKGGHGDTYYQWMIKYIYAYKNHLDCPECYENGKDA